MSTFSPLFRLAVLTVCTVILATPLTVQAKRVESEKAQKVAQRFAESKRGPQAQKNVRLKHTGRKQRQGPGGGSGRPGRPGTGTQGGQEDTLYYVFNIDTDEDSSGGGFIIVAGDDVAKPVLGYSDEGGYDENNLPPEFVYWMDFLQDEIAFAQEQNIPQSEDIQQEWDAFLNGNIQTLKKTAAAVAPLIQTKWNQGDDTYPYNNMCPMDGKKRSITGCVATAMAQIMKYHNHPARGIGQSKAYTTSSKKISVPSVNLEVSYDWNNMLNEYTRSCNWWTLCIVKNNNWNETQANAVAKLMYHAGVSVEMDYSSNSSGAFSSVVDDVLRNNFGYDMNTQFTSRYLYTNDGWESMLKGQINAGMPIYYAGSGSSGHAFICDGYDNSGKFHFNWGWGGAQDGYFVTTALKTNNGTFSDNQRAIINIKPAPPTITTQPIARIIQVGQTTQFTVAAKLNGASTLSYQWQVSTNGGSSFSNLPGATSATYTTTTATVAMSGYIYRCVVKNNRGVSVTSNDATLTVNPIPPTVVWPTAAAITYGNILSSSTLSGGSATGVGGMSVAGSFAWNNNWVIPTVANNGYSATFTPYDNNYTVVTKNDLAITVNKANPAYSVPTGLTAVYGDLLSDVTLPWGWSWDVTGSVGNTGARIHNATFTPTDVSNYNVATGINVTVTVAKAAPIYTIPSGLTATYGDSLSSVVLPDGWSWNVNGMVGNAGTQIHKATFTPADTGNYNVATNINVAVTVAKSPLTYMVPVGLTAAYGDSLSSVILPENWSWDEVGTVGGIGTQIHKATFTPTDTVNYKIMTGIDVTVTVTKAFPVYTVPSGLTATYGDLLSSVVLPRNWSWEGTGNVGNAGTRIHKATFTPTDTVNYNIVTGIDVKITVAKAVPVYTVPSGIRAAYGDILSNVVLPVNWSWDGTGSVGNAGTRIHKATFTPLDTWNYSVVSDINVTVTVAKAAPVYTAPSGLTATYGDVISSVILPAGWSWEGTGRVGNAGTRTHKATFTPTDTWNYNIATGIDVTVTVAKAAPIYTVPSGLTAVYGESLSSVVLPVNWSWEGTGSVGNTGTQIHKATFTPADTGNYNIVTGIDVTITVIAKSAPDYTVPSGLTATYGDSISHVILPEGWSWEETGTVGNVGIQTHKATFTPADTKKYNVVTGIKVTITVNKATAVQTSDRTIPTANHDKEATAVAPIAPLTAEFTAGPNPASRSSGKVSFFRNGSRVAYATLSIYDASGKVVKKIRVIDDAVGSQLRRKVSSWNLRDDKGRLVAEGTYLVRGVVKTAGGKRERVEVVVGVR